MSNSKKLFFWILTFCAYIIILFLIGELVTRVSKLDMALLRPLLYYQQAFPEVHQVSQNINLLYELKPNTMITEGVPGNVTINELGFRDKSRSPEKPPGVFRIICLGGSNTFGAEVGDEETYPAYLERLLNEGLDRKFEVWNAGVSAYVLSQKVEMARLAIKKYDPDLLIFRHDNGQRRAFLCKTDFAGFFEKTPQLYWENLKFMPSWNNKLLKRLFIHSALFRAIVISLNHLVTIPQNNQLYNNESIINESKFVEFYKEYNKKIPIVLMPFEKPSSYAMFNEAIGDIIYLFEKRHLPKEVGPEYFIIHPPAYVYKWYAEVIMKELIRMGYLNQQEKGK